MSWFERLTGVEEGVPDEVRRQLRVEGTQLVSDANGKLWTCGTLEIVSLAELRERVQEGNSGSSLTGLEEVVAGAQQLHVESANAGACFQVASQFNLLEMISPRVTPEDGVGIYEGDPTQGPACAIAAGPGTIYRNYFVLLDGQIGQTAGRQVDCLADIGSLLGNVDNRLWHMVNGYAIPTPDGLQEVCAEIERRDEEQLDEIRQRLRIGVQWNTQVTLPGASHLVTQVYCSAMPVSYTRQSREEWASFASLILEAAYEATLCSAMLNARSTGNHRLYLTLLGGGAFGNDPQWICSAIRRAVRLYPGSGLEIAIVSYGSSKIFVQDLIREVRLDVRFG